jgi:hypothetical protein
VRLHSLALAIAGAFIAGASVSWLAALRRRSPALREQDRIIRELWSAARSLPTDHVLRDPVTGSGLCAERGLTPEDLGERRDGLPGLDTGHVRLAGLDVTG